MAKQQYRIYTAGDWTSNFGASFLAIQNVSGSGKKITIRQIEAQVASGFFGQAIASNAMFILVRCTAPLLGGENMGASSVRMDTSVAIPSTVVVRRLPIATSYTDIIRRVDLAKRVSVAATVNDYRFQNRTFGLNRSNGLVRSSAKQTAVEPIILGQNQACVLVAESVNSAVSFGPIRVNVTASINNKVVVWDFVSPMVPGCGVVSIENTGTDTVRLLQISVAEVGTTDTPTIRVVPIGQINSNDLPDASKQNVTAMPMNTTYGALSSSVCKLFSDIMIKPYAVPEVYITEGSAGSPKGMNYLHTRDFDGPMYRNFLPEVTNTRQAGATCDTLGLYGSQKWSDLLMRRKSACPATGIILNPGEGMALVSSAETAAGGVQPAWSGWPLLFFGLYIDVEPSTVPQISISGMVPTSRYRIERVSDSSTVIGGVADGTGSATFLYETEDTPLTLRLKVRKATSAPFYKPYEITFNLTSAGIALPVSQTLDL